MKQLLIETSIFVPEMFDDNYNGTKLTKVRGPFQRANIVNGNNRIYRKEPLAKEVERLQEKVKMRALYNQLDHPNSSEISLKDACALTTKLEMQDDLVVGECELLTTPNGLLLKELFNCKASVGISSRAMGSLVESTEVPNCMEVADLSIICWDFVGEPSVPGCYMTIAEAKKRYLSNAYSYGLKDKDTRKALVEYIKLILGEKK